MVTFFFLFLVYGFLGMLVRSAYFLAHKNLTDAFVSFALAVMFLVFIIIMIDTVED